MAERKSKVYIVTDPQGGKVVVRASTSSAALAHVVATVRKTYSVDQASIDELIDIGKTGVTIHDADRPAEVDVE